MNDDDIRSQTKRKFALNRIEDALNHLHWVESCGMKKQTHYFYNQHYRRGIIRRCGERNQQHPLLELTV